MLAAGADDQVDLLDRATGQARGDGVGVDLGVVGVQRASDAFDDVGAAVVPDRRGQVCRAAGCPGDCVTQRLLGGLWEQ